VDLTVRWEARGREEKLLITQYVANTGQGALGPLIQMGVLQDLAGGVVPQPSMDFEDLQPVIKDQGGGP